MPTTRTYAVGDNATVLRRDNHSGSWIDVSPVIPFTINWNDVMCDPTNPDKVVVVGTVINGVGIGVSSDAGVTWTSPAGNWAIGPKQFAEVWFVDTNTIWAVDFNGYVVRSVNGGLSFDQVTSIVGYNYCGAIHALDDYVAVVGATIASTNTTKVFKTIDGGISWQELNGGSQLPPVNNDVGPVNGIWISGDQRNIIVTTEYTQNVSSNFGATFFANAPEFSRSGEHLTWYPSHQSNPSHFRHVGGFPKNVALSTDLGSTFTIVRDFSTGGLIILGAHFYTPSNGYYIVEDDIYSTSDGAVTGTISYTGSLLENRYLRAVWTQTPIPDCNCTRFRFDKASCCIDLVTTGSIVINLAKVCAQATENGKQSFVFTSGLNSFKLYWSSSNSRWELLWINSGNLLLAYLPTDTLCPYGSWTITTNHSFITSLTTALAYKTGIGVDCNDQGIVIEVPFDSNDTSTAGNWTERLCLKSWYITNQGDLAVESEISSLCRDTEEGFECPIWYKLVDCRNENNTLCVSNDLGEQFASNTIIQIEGFPETCWRIEEDEDCINNENQIVITGSFIDCEDCLPDQPAVGVACETTIRLGEPGFSTKYCDPEELIRIKCTYASSVYALFKRLRYGIQTCCEYDLDKADIKNMLIDLGEMYDPDMCVPVVVPVVCCPQPCNAEVEIHLPSLIGCPIPTNPLVSIEIDGPPCLNPEGPAITSLEL